MSEVTVKIVDTGGAAFPNTGSEAFEGRRDLYPEIGMSLRDYFAIHAPVDVIDYLSADSNALARYSFADEMLKARKQ